MVKRQTGQPSAERPDAPTWRTPPAQSRKKMRKQQSVLLTIALNAGNVGRRSGAAKGTPRPLDTLRGLNWRRIAAGVLAVALVVALIVSLQLPIFAVTANATQIGGVRRNTPEAVFAASQVTGRNLFLLRAMTIEEAVRTLPGVAQAHVHLRLPNQVIIDVEEYAPLVIWQTNAEVAWLAEDGEATPQVGDPPPLTLTDLTGQGLSEAQVRWPHLLADLATLHAAFPNLKAVSLSVKEGLHFAAPEGWQIWLGVAPVTEAKCELVAATVRNLTAQGIQPTVIDVRFSDKEAFWW